MRIVIQRVSRASVSLEHPEELEGAEAQSHLDNVSRETSLQPHPIGRGFLLLVGVSDADGDEEVHWAAHKIAHLRVFSDENDKMNLSLLDIHGQILSVSQFTLFGDIHKGNRPSFISAGKPDHATRVWKQFNAELHNQYGIDVQTGWFGTDMAVSLVNDGPTTILMDTDRDMPHRQ
jgi:D-tyrosyl-tRNA(Tyr) deacylase